MRLSATNLGAHEGLVDFKSIDETADPQDATAFDDEVRAAATNSFLAIARCAGL
jgi:hypothetical protein